MRCGGDVDREIEAVIQRFEEFGRRGAVIDLITRTAKLLLLWMIRRGETDEAHASHFARADGSSTVVEHDASPEYSHDA